MKALLVKVWAKFKAPIVYLGAALGALLLVVVDAIMLGRRLEKRKQIKEAGKDEQAKIDAMHDAGDGAALREDILRRTGRD